MTHNRYHPFKDHDDYARAALDGRLLLAQAGGHAGHVLPTQTAPVVVTKDMVDEVIEEAAARKRDARIAELEAEIAELSVVVRELEDDEMWWDGAVLALRAGPEWLAKTQGWSEVKT